MHEPDDTPNSLHISVKALELILRRRLEEFQPAAQLQGEPWAARICGYTPGMRKFELVLETPGPLPRRLERRETVTVLSGKREQAQRRSR